MTFRYPGTDRPALRDVSFAVEEGPVAALAGPSGGGKFTACKLAARFWDIQGGKISRLQEPRLFAENEFVPARLVMSCCVADLAPSRVVCKYDKVSELESDSWVTVTGTLYRGQYEGQDEPQIKVSSVAPADPVEGYLYPFS